MTAHVIRAWERRYGAISPNRSTDARRQYSDWEVQRLVLLRQAVDLGHRIGEVANLPMEELHALVARDELPGVEASPRIPYAHPKLIEAAIVAAASLDSRAFLQSLLQATRTLTPPALFEDFVDPLLTGIGRHSQSGHLRAASEHFASAHLRTFLGILLTSGNVDLPGPCLIVTTPKGHVDEIGAAMSAITALRAGWEAAYLGPSLPAEEVVHAVDARRARAVVVSLCHTDNDPDMVLWLKTLRGLLTPSVEILVCGKSASLQADALTLTQLGAALETLRDAEKREESTA